MSIINSNSNELALANWLYENDPRSYQNTRKFQKFLFFYEVFSKVNEKEYDLGRFKIWMHGPVNSVAYGDYTYRGADFVTAFKKVEEKVDQEIARKADFLVQILNTEEISELTHTFDFWKIPAIKLSGSWKNNVSASEKNFSSTDMERAHRLYTMYDDTFIRNSEVIHTFGKHFVISKSDKENLTSDHIEVLEKLSTDTSLMNPIFVEIDNDGRLAID